MHWSIWLTLLVTSPFTLLGMFTLFHLLRSSKPPMDASNRFNRVRLWWFALTRPEYLAPNLPWTANDELDNMAQVTKVIDATRD